MAERLKIPAWARSIANASTLSEINSKRPFCMCSAAPGQEAEKGCLGTICRKWLKLGMITCMRALFFEISSPKKRNVCKMVLVGDLKKI